MQQLLSLPVNQRAISTLLTPFYFLFQSKKLLLRLAMLVMSVGMMSGVVGQATITNDKPDYAPRSNAVFTGSGFAPGETVTLKVKNLSRACNTVTPDSSYSPWTVLADANGAFVANWTVCDCAGDSLRLRATGFTSKDTAYAYFTDADPITITGSFCNGSPTTNFSLTVPTTASNIKCIRLEFTGLPSGVTITNVSTGGLPSGWSGTTGGTSTNISTSGSALPISTSYNFSVTFSASTGGSYVTSYKSGNICPSNTNGGNSTSISSVGIVNPPTAVNFSGSYDGASHAGSATVSSGEVVDWYTDATGNTSSTAPSGTNFGTYTAYAEARNTTTGCRSTTRTLVTVAIAKATASIVVNGYTGTYDGNAHGATLGSATGVNSENLASSVTIAPTTYTNYPGGQVTWSFTNNNYEPQNGAVDIVINKATASIVVNGYTGTYDGNAHGATGTATGVGGVDLAAGLNLGVTFTDVPGGTANWTFNGGTNYNNQSGSVAIVINKKVVTITPNSGQYKYCGQTDPIYTYSASETLLSGNSYSGALSRSGTESVGSYSYNIGTLSAGNNYSLELTGSSVFEIRGITVDASASSTPVQLGTAANLSATVTPAASGITVVFTLDDGNGHIYTYSDETDASGLATVSTVSNLPLEVYKITAVAGSGCATSVAYLPIYDPNGSFVTGGGWINSPAGALTANTSLVGKANFGFVSKYKKGSSTVEGNTEFQFTAGDINFKSTLHESGSLVISGAKATYRGVGTINGVAGYKFTLVAIDGNWNNGTGADRFRIKITTTSGGVVYDNQMGKDENADDATALGGGSIVIHEVKKKTSNRMEAPVFVLASQDFNVKVLGNPSLTTFRLQLQSNNMQEKFTVKVVDVNGRLIEVQQNLYTGQVIELGSKYTQGTYFAEVMQGTNRKVVKLVKISRD